MQGDPLARPDNPTQNIEPQSVATESSPGLMGGEWRVVRGREGDTVTPAYA